MVLGRFAPSPSGRMHLGNAFSALLAWLSAKSKGGEIVLRVEDLDPARSRPEYAEAIMADFQWLGLHWDRRAENQSLRGSAERSGKIRCGANRSGGPCHAGRMLRYADRHQRRRQNGRGAPSPRL